MAYSSDKTWVAAEVVSASDMNTYLRDNMKWVSTDKPMYRGYSSAAVSASNETWTSVTMDTERFDNAAVHSTSANTDRMTAPSGGAGKYLAGGHIEFAVDADGDERYCRLLINGATVVAQQSGLPISGTVTAHMSVCTMYALAVADYVSLQGYQDGGGALDIAVTGNRSPEAWCLWVGV